MIERNEIDDAKAEERPAEAARQSGQSGSSDAGANGMPLVPLVAHDALAELFAEVARRSGLHAEVSYVDDVWATVTVRGDERAEESPLSLMLTANNMSLREDIPYKYITTVMERWEAALARFADSEWLPYG